MREIKFRAWDRNNKCWYHSPQLVIRPYSGKVNDGATTPNVELMQYTGLKDKNGKDIFEGDIVKVHDLYKQCSEDCHEFTGVVEFNNASFLINQNDFIKHYRWMDYECEVIGNIYENPELL